MGLRELVPLSLKTIYCVIVVNINASITLYDYTHSVF